MRLASQVTLKCYGRSSGAAADDAERRQRLIGCHNRRLPGFASIRSANTAPPHGSITPQTILKA
jgi:hypothetical protein